MSEAEASDRTKAPVGVELRRAVNRMSRDSRAMASCLGVGRWLTRLEVQYIIGPLVPRGSNVGSCASYLTDRLYKLGLARRRWNDQRHYEFWVFPSAAKAMRQRNAGGVEDWLQEARQSARERSVSHGRTVSSDHPSALLGGGESD